MHTQLKGPDASRGSREHQAVWQCGEQTERELLGQDSLGLMALSFTYCWMTDVSLPNFEASGSPYVKWSYEG